VKPLFRIRHFGTSVCSTAQAWTARPSDQEQLGGADPQRAAELLVGTVRDREPHTGHFRFFPVTQWPQSAHRIGSIETDGFFFPAASAARTARETA
jgi:hypothetical protein